MNLYQLYVMNEYPECDYSIIKDIIRLKDTMRKMKG